MSTTLTVDGMNCDGCADIITGALEEVSGVDDASADLDAKTVSVDGDADADDLLEAVEFAGYDASIDEAADETDDADEEADAEAADDEGDADDEE
ncbi:heavy-metal-associated domain-containing protein [Halocalculus aciditolerans]|uniref:HMA domain-containing protein n=1 Tax=Halocalculus aciditolerans TaxID=1383812 RepID=A0A830FME0_9EURY|nr:heavy-metal-associated domain-containing protein [Halocalculus aciditolerans]GGL60635.1 hypothetical protein GCM10009039_18630 [Halocalculus aciditolerans]